MLHENNPTLLAVALLVVSLGSFVLDAKAVSEINVTPGKTLVGPGLAIHGFDPVAYFTKGEPKQGLAEYSLVHGGATYRFADASNMKAFKANPDRFVPAFGGYCAYGVAVGAKFDGDPRFWKIVDDKLYLNLNRKIQDTWLKDVPGNIGRAAKKWEQIKHSDPEKLG